MHESMVGITFAIIGFWFMKLGYHVWRADPMDPRYRRKSGHRLALVLRTGRRKTYGR